MTSNIELIQKTVDALEVELEKINNELFKIQKIDNLIILRNRDPDMFYQLAPEILKNKGIDLESFLFNLIPPLNDNIIIHFKNAFEGNDAEYQFELGEKGTLEIKEELLNQKTKLNQSINEARIQLLQEENKNPLENIKFGESSKIRELFLYNPESTIKRISQLVVDVLRERKKARQPYKKGDFDFRRTMKHAIGNEGIPIEFYYRNKAQNTTKEKPRIYLILDVSGSCTNYIPLAATLAYAFSYALSEYDIILYTASNCKIIYDPKSYFDNIKTMEKKDFVGRSSIADFIRLNEKYIKSNIKNPLTLYEEIGKNLTNICDYSINMVEALIDVAPDNSIFLVLTDTGFRNRYELSKYIKSKQFCAKFDNFKNNIFYFNLYTSFDSNCVRAIENFKFGQLYNSSGRKIDEMTGSNYSPNFESMCDKIKIPEKNIYPYYNRNEIPTTYDDWLQQVLKLLKTALI